MYDEASRDIRVQGACDAAIRSALLAGDFAHDAETTYAELYRVSRRFAPAGDAGVEAGVGGACASQASERLRALAAFKPADRLLTAIDDGLAAEGSLGTAALLDAAVASGPPKVTRVERWDGKDAARVVITLSDKATYRAGDDAVAGLGVAGQVITLFIILFSFVGIGSSVVITHHLGAKDRAGADAQERGLALDDPFAEQPGQRRTRGGHHGVDEGQRRRAVGFEVRSGVEAEPAHPQQ